VGHKCPEKASGVLLSVYFELQMLHFCCLAKAKLPLMAQNGLNQCVCVCVCVCACACVYAATQVW